MNSEWDLHRKRAMTLIFLNRIIVSTCMTISLLQHQAAEPSNEPAIGQGAHTMASSKTESRDENQSFLLAGQEDENKRYSSFASGASGADASESTAEKRQHLENTTT